MSSERSYCSERSLAAGEPMAGTADPVDVWVLLEYLPVWGAKATTDNALAAPTKAWLAGLVNDVQQRGLQPRVQFIRQPEIERVGVTLMVAADGALHRIEMPDYASLARLSLDAVLATPPVDAAQYFVCTNGQRDVCCARFGLPVYTALRERAAERVWQTTHVGGHRFAPNVLTLPQGAMYGRLQPGDVDEFVTCIEGDGLAVRWLRGRSRFPAAVQTAEAALAARGADTAGAMHCSADGSGGYRVHFGSNAVTVRPGPAYEAFASCGDPEPKRVTPLHVDEHSYLLVPGTKRNR
jgi:hypothetical protein